MYGATGGASEPEISFPVCSLLGQLASEVRSGMRNGGRDPETRADH